MGEKSEGACAAVVDCCLWGKEDKLPGPYPVVCHLVDTAAMAGALWDEWFDAAAVAKLAEVAGVTGRELRALVCFWAGLHDVGKISPPFQAKVLKLYERLLKHGRYGPSTVPEADRGLHHSEVTQWVLAGILAELGYPTYRTSRRKHVAHQIAQLLGGHHGRFFAPMTADELSAPREHRPGIGSGEWEEQSRLHVEVLRRLVGVQAVPNQVLPAAAAVVIAGVVIVADWLASQEEFITPRVPSESWVASRKALETHWSSAVQAAPGVVARAGLGRAEFRDVDFAKLFGFEPNELQKSLVRELPDLVRGPGLLLVTAPPGDGKTEAAWWAATLLARASGAAGVGFSLPTMATVDAMHRRVTGYATATVDGDAALTRVHSMSWLSEVAESASAQSAAEGQRVVSGESSAMAAAQWLHAGSRGLLAPLSVFTIDQALTGVLPVRYNVLRLLALSGKVVVIDEAHAYGPWMHTLLLSLLEWLGAMRAPVVVLSATLTGATARSLVDAYLRGGGRDRASEADSADWRPCYPGWVYADAVGGEVSQPRRVTSERARELDLVRLPVRRGIDPTNDDRQRIAVIKHQLAPVLAGGGCVLVCCTTVAEAQQTWGAIDDWLETERARGAHRIPELHLLHSRFRAQDRATATSQCEGIFGKKGNRPAEGAILVATQIVEQSLDLDFDLIITDLAPMAMLLQRSGRCLRHRDEGKKQDPHADRRPPWLPPHPRVRVVVLDPVGHEGEFELPASWGAVYDEALLATTSRLLAQYEGRTVAVPGDVQQLVDAVYDGSFSAVNLERVAQREWLEGLHAKRLADEATKRQLASITHIPPPDDIGCDLHRLSETSVPVDESLITTRLGADSARVVCVYDQGDGRWTLDEAGEAEVPAWGRTTRLTRDEARVLAQHLIPVPGRWVSEGAVLLEAPASWTKNAATREWRPLPMRRERKGWRGRLGREVVAYSTDCGLHPD